MKIFGCDEPSLRWFRSYLTKRTQFVQNGDHISRTLEVRTGVPQGSVLGSLLFSIFINDLIDVNIEGDLYLYADDSTLICSANNFQNLESKVNLSLYKINNWIQNNNLSLNYEKSNYLLINFNCHQCSDLEIKINGNKIQRVFKTKILGIFFDQNLHFKEHINYISDKVSKRIKLFYRLNYILPKNTLNILYKSLVQPLVDYGICVYGFTYSANYQRLEALQRKAAKLITSSDTDNSSLYKTLKWFAFTDRRNYFASIVIFKCLNNFSPNICQTFFRFKQTVRKTRHTIVQELEKQFSSLTIFRKTIFYSGVEFYNSLDINIRITDNFKNFIKNLRNFYQFK